MQKGHNPLGNRVTFDLIDIDRLCVAQVAETLVHAAPTRRIGVKRAAPWLTPP
jgi:hypothetical protein